MSKHFAHKISVVEDEGEGRFALPPGPASARADQTGLTLRAEAADAEGLSRSMFISKDHLLRFAFREEPAPLNWVDA